MAVFEELNLVVRNLGPVREANIEIPVKGITVIIGPNSSGKTFIAQSLYLMLETLIPVIVKALSKAVRELSNECVKGVKTLCINSKEFSLEDAVKFLLKNADYFEVAVDISEEFSNVYGVSHDIIVKQDFTIILNLGNQVIEEALAKEDKIIIKVKVNHDVLRELLESLSERIGTEEIDLETIEEFLEERLIETYSKLAKAMFVSSVYIPSERIAAMTTFSSLLSAYLEVLGSIVAGVGIARKRGLFSERPLLLKFMSALIDSLKDFKPSLEEVKLIGGSILYDERSGAVKFKVKGVEKPIPPNIMSSGSLQLAALVPVVRNKRYNYVIIEEPEINIHVNLQLDLAEYLWSVKDKTLFITTHSDVFLMQLARLSVRDKSRKLKAYLLHNGVTRELHVDENGEIEEIPTIAEALNRLLA